ncbi:methylmalonyl-CoA mutase family protein [Microvirga lotononidis]|uniref:Methylmalonyl-CoA mutase, N-terminal domain/subunit n=1 Tax=Microvirga lotononidis TaxID=864069 RepID=I4YNJ5_9HYPH|nr:methylmalonyl-CoA mutase family protein [Microvirga lotononidis]EIM25537.1 methylmalonyl-CoA mutase, N-terminal domain/subunit [Microvirga lotononidis]WQO26155.1 methylmalonyl-CoA mutase family protein [Microvirga lotononidis]
MDDLSLAADFPQATREQWLKRVEGVLKGADFRKKLVARSHDGIDIQPLYPKAEGSAPVAREQAGRWRVSQRMDHPEPERANELALLDLEGGADALTLVAHKAPAARGFGVQIGSLDDLDRALSGVMLDLIHLRVDAGGHGRQMAALVLALAKRRGHKLSDLSIDLGLDPVGAMAAQGKMSASWDTMAGRMGDTLGHLTEQGFAGRVFLADGRVYHEAGASEAQELAAVLATAVGYLRALETQGHSPDAARRALSFLLVADAEEFLTVAKLRALRRLWARVEQACGLDPRPIRLHAETAWRMTTRRDPWVNMLRITVAAFSAGIGGADAVTVLPFTAALGLPDAFARRVARNTQLILLDESNLSRVADPAAGAGGFEALTDALCDKAWELFQEIEREGGILESLKADGIQSRIAAVRAQREKAVATRREPITGTSEFPNIHEADVAVLIPASDASSSPRAEEKAGGDQIAPAETSFSALVRMAGQGATLPQLVGTASGAAPVAIAPLPSTRAAEPFERLRDRADAHLATTGERPRIFLANLGPIAAFTGRATFAKNFFEAAGIEAVTNDGFSDNDALRQAYLDSKARLACICSTDEIYEQHAEQAARALGAAGCPLIALAGRPGEREEPLIRAGIGMFIYAGCDTLTILSRALDEACA